MVVGPQRLWTLDDVAAGYGAERTLNEWTSNANANNLVIASASDYLKLTEPGMQEKRYRFVYDIRESNGILTSTEFDYTRIQSELSGRIVGYAGSRLIDPVLSPEMRIPYFKSRMSKVESHPDAAYLHRVLQAIFNTADTLPDMIRKIEFLFSRPRNRIKLFIAGTEGRVEHPKRSVRFNCSQGDFYINCNTLADEQQGRVRFLRQA